MNKLDPIGELLQRVLRLLPAGANDLRDDLGKNVKTVVAAMLARMDLVTREEFDVQTAVLARTRARLETIERQLADLETALAQQGSEPPS